MWGWGRSPAVKHSPHKWANSIFGRQLCQKAKQNAKYVCCAEGEIKKMHVQKLQGHRQKLIKTEQHLSTSEEDRKGRTRSDTSIIALNRSRQKVWEPRGKSTWLANLTAWVQSLKHTHKALKSGTQRCASGIPALLREMRSGIRRDPQKPAGQRAWNTLLSKHSRRESASRRRKVRTKVVLYVP